MNGTRGFLRLRRYYSSGLRVTYHKTLDRIELMLPPKLRPLYNHPAGPKTVFFWAPVFKWGLVFAGFSDMTRPPEKLSFSQSCVITATGSKSGKCALDAKAGTSVTGAVAPGLPCGRGFRPTPKSRYLLQSGSILMPSRGFIWSRYCLVIVPRIWALFAVNFFLGLCGSIQLLRIWKYNQQLKQNKDEVQLS